MELYLLRHAVAVERGAPGYEKDDLRPLTAEGRRKMAKAATGMKRLGLSFEGILSSPFPRARATAEIVAGTLRLSRRLRMSEHLTPGGSSRELLRELERMAKPASRWLLVGHEPDLSRLAARLLGGPATLGLKLKKGALCKLVLERIRFGACAELEWLLTTKLLMRIR